jgi:probable O-glycosylation ligase (exosortase A-associated)
MAAVSLALWWRAKNKLAIGTVAAIAIVIGVALVPQKWLDRMDTIQNYEQDKSATGRLEIWGHAIRIANDRPLIGGGFGVFDHEPTYLRLSPEMINRRNVHSIYFEMLGTQGYIGLLIFVLLGTAGLVIAGQVMKRTDGVPGLENEYKFAKMAQLSLVAFAVTGTFLNLSTWDLYYALLAMIVMQRSLLEKKLAAGVVATAVPGQEQNIAAHPAAPAIPRHMPGRSFLRQPAK